MTDMAHKEGVFEKSESTIIKNLLRFEDIPCKGYYDTKSSYENSF